ncbi:lipopolysaccharide/colanic/teichoic acid biosynthesis glycosyltransferase [Rhizobium sp. BK077]|nr:MULTISPECIES: sugar transferase [Rhizobium]MBB3302896.1 lipopolysaccharide/colanic/teichoic acid biosynthesis glycosyltransferase [Rhizobium sp. BK112]MBB3372239.1 lipopolysaccharide/colanic/teichoic acid biosynthesis glycosyltransferase [Rhizobium sp. BK077]MBB4182756.1 lipopolysaccharide/colanic/teichoic acid biosynthesis glycosyltransferase [Rhizobium sp. BK109]PDS54590.1 exopolysaccharide biosynthesis protein [Rhizobium anhuiense]
MLTVTTKDSVNNIYSEIDNDKNTPSDCIDVLAIGQAASRSARWDFFLKRLFDIYASSTALLILAPLLVVIGVLIRLETRGSPLFSQTRWGKDGKKITVYKFRSMRSEACDPSGVIQTVENDPRITFLGRILRKTNLDELPQLFNVLRGDMSLVGPRCHAIGMLAGGMLYEELVPAYHRRHSMRPGLTGLAQMRGLRGPTDRPAKARARINADLYYIDNFSFWLDLKIIFGTIAGELRGGNGF